MTPYGDQMMACHVFLNIILKRSYNLKKIDKNLSISEIMNKELHFEKVQEIDFNNVHAIVYYLGELSSDYPCGGSWAMA